MMRDSKTITMEQCDLPTKFTAMDPTPDYLTDLLHQFGAFKSSVIKKEWLVALLQQMKGIASTTGSDSSDDTEWTHPDFALVCHDPHSKATKPELLAHLTAWCDALNIKETSDWGSIGTYKEPLELVVASIMSSLRAQLRPRPRAPSTSNVHLEHDHKKSENAHTRRNKKTTLNTERHYDELQLD